MSTNRFPATCARCGETVDPGDGLVSGGKGSDGSWRVVHNSCLPPDPTEEPPPEDYWQKSVIRRIRHLVEELERLDPDDLDVIRATPQAALLREWIKRPSKQEYDL